MRVGARVPPDRRTARPWPCRCWLAYPWAGGLPGVRAGAGCCGVPARGPVAVLVGVPVPVCHQIDTRPARGCAGCWRAYPVGRWPAWRACRVPVGGARGQGAYLVAVPVLAGLPVGPCACRVPVGVRLPLSRWPCWWACRCPSATRSTHGLPVAVPVLAGLPLSRCACPVASASPCPGDSPTAHPIQLPKAILKAWHATCNPHKTCLIDLIYLEARQVARYDHTRAETLPASPP